MFLHVTEARHLEGYKIEVSFNNGKKGIADLSAVLKGPVFEPLREVSAFSQLYVNEELETVVWPNGADLAPEYIYFQAFRNHPEFTGPVQGMGLHCLRDIVRLCKKSQPGSCVECAARTRESRWPN